MALMGMRRCLRAFEEVGGGGGEAKIHQPWPKARLLPICVLDSHTVCWARSLCVYVAVLIRVQCGVSAGVFHGTGWLSPWDITLALEGLGGRVGRWWVRARTCVNGLLGEPCVLLTLFIHHTCCIVLYWQDVPPGYCSCWGMQCVCADVN